MAQRRATAGIILEIEKTQKIMQRLINYYKYLEDLLKGSPARRNAREVRKYFEILKNNYLENFKKQMKKLYEIEKRAERKRIQEAKKREKAAKKLQEQARKIRKGVEKLKRI